MAHVFISHVEEDAETARAIAEALELLGFVTWFYERDALAGPSYLVQTGEAIDRSSAVLLVVSKQGLSSHQITKEVVRAHEANKPFVPVLVDVSDAEYKTRQPEWREAIGAATSISFARGLTQVIDSIAGGLVALGVPRRQQPVPQALRAGQTTVSPSYRSAGRRMVEGPGPSRVAAPKAPQAGGSPDGIPEDTTTTGVLTMPPPSWSDAVGAFMRRYFHSLFRAIATPRPHVLSADATSVRLAIANAVLAYLCGLSAILLYQVSAKGPSILWQLLDYFHGQYLSFHFLFAIVYVLLFIAVRAVSGLILFVGLLIVHPIPLRSAISSMLGASHLDWLYFAMTPLIYYLDETRHVEGVVATAAMGMVMVTYYTVFLTYGLRLRHTLSRWQTALAAGPVVLCNLLTFGGLAGFLWLLSGIE